MRVKKVSLSDAMTALKGADAALHAAKTVKERRAAALAFARAERDARAAKKRETTPDSILDNLK